MKKNILINRLVRFIIIAACPVLLNSCLMEYPEMTENGEIGIDPTLVTVNAVVSVDLGSSEAGNVDLDSRLEEKIYKHRIVVAAYEGREVRAQKIIYEDKPLTNRLQTEVKLELHARKYTLVTWVDYYCEDENPIYDIYTDQGLILIRKGNNNYLGNSEYKKAYYSSEELDLTEYKDRWGETVPVEVKTISPMIRYELVATDVQKFLDNNPHTESIQLTLTYNDYVPTGFNALDGITKEAFKFQSFSRTIKRPENNPKELSLLFDYVFVDDVRSRNSVSPLSVTLKVEDVTDPNKKVELASSTFNLVFQNTVNEKITFDFLTTKPGDGVDVDTDFGGNAEVEVPVE